MSFYDLRKEWDGVANVSILGKNNRIRIQNYIQAIHKRGEIIRCFRSGEDMMMLCHRKPRLPDFFRLPPRGGKNV